MTAAGDLASLARVVGSLVVVLVVVALCARLARRTRGARPGAGLRVLDRTGLSREASLAVVEFEGRSLVLGVTTHAVTVLAESHTVPALPPPDPTRPAGSSDETRPRVAAEVPAGRRAAPERVRPRVPLPRGVDLAAHPDLASALRAAGRTLTADAEPAPPAPRTRAEARGRARRPATTGVPRRANHDHAVNGSVLSPATWRQGLEGLRDLTARRG